MESVARQADVGTSTLYRYFPTKESLAVAAIGEPQEMANTLLGRPGDESVEIGLGHAIIAFLESDEEAELRSRKFQELISRNSRLHPQLLAWLDEAYLHLRAALAARTGASSDDAWVSATASLVIFVLRRASEISTHGRDNAAMARQIMNDLSKHPIMLPKTLPL